MGYTSSSTWVFVLRDSGDQEQGERAPVVEYDHDTLPRYLDTLDDPPFDGEGGSWPYSPESPPHAKVSEGDQNMDGARPLDSLGLWFMAHINDGTSTLLV